MEMITTVNIINGYLNKEIEPKQIIDTWSQSFEFILRCFNESAELDLEHIEQIRKSVFFMSKILLEEELSDELSEFLIAFSLIIYNWNENTIKANDLEVQCQMLKKMSEMRSTMLESIRIITATNQQLSSLKNWRVPAYDVTKQHLGRMLEKFKE